MGVKRRPGASCRAWRGVAGRGGAWRDAAGALGAAVHCSWVAGLSAERSARFAMHMACMNNKPRPIPCHAAPRLATPRHATPRGRLPHIVKLGSLVLASKSPAVLCWSQAQAVLPTTPP